MFNYCQRRLAMDAVGYIVCRSSYYFCTHCEPMVLGYDTQNECFIFSRGMHVFALVLTKTMQLFLKIPPFAP